jgi:hypothetical protein
MFPFVESNKNVTKVKGLLKIDEETQFIEKSFGDTKLLNYCDNAYKSVLH